MGNKPVVFVDIDQTIADLFSVWLMRYNQDYNDTLTVNDLTEWEITAAVKPEARENILSYLSARDIYHHVLPLPQAQPAIHFIRNSLNMHVVFASSCAYESFQDKIDWLIKNGFIPTANQGKARRYFIGIKDKSLLAGDFLVDDKPENVNNFNGIGILFSQPYNLKSELLPHVQRAHDWTEVIKIILNTLLNRETNE